MLHTPDHISDKVYEWFVTVSLKAESLHHTPDHISDKVYEWFVTVPLKSESLLKL